MVVRSLLFLVCLAGIATGAAASVLVVDTPDPTAFSTIQAAINASSDGDTILSGQAPRTPIAGSSSMAAA